MTAKRITGMADIKATLRDEVADIVYWKDEDGLWWIYLPGCGAGVLSKHTVVENEDRTITVTPSILMSGHQDGKPTTRHGYLTAGEWREC